MVVPERVFDDIVPRLLCRDEPQRRITDAQILKRKQNVN